jgi:hypothetical protein
MRRPLVLLGALVLGSGVAMYIMLGQLKSDFFRAYLPPWVYASYAAMGLGGAVLAAGVALRSDGKREVSTDAAAVAMGKLALVNAVAAAIFVAPVLYPGFRFPILITQWPGIYMVLAYVSFVMVGVLGTAAWTMFYFRAPDLFHRERLGATGVALHAAMTEVGVYGVSVSMFLGGYVGSWLAYTGAGPVAVGAQMEFSVIPAAVSIFLVGAGTFVGVVNLLWRGRSVPN